MQRSAGVAAVAIAVLIGSILLLGLGALAAGLALVMPQIPRPDGTPAASIAALMLVGSLVYILPGIWGVVSGIGLWRLKNWARVSTIVLAVLAGLGGAMALLIAFVFLALPLPSSEGLDPVAAARALAIARGVIFALSVVLLGIAIWWGVILTRPAVVRQFTGDAEGKGTATGLPLSISVVAVLMLIGAPLAFVSILMRTPVPLFTTILTGWAAVAYAIGLAGILTYCGWGLLHRKPEARLLSIAYFVVALVSSGVFFLAPGHEARLTALTAAQHALLPFVSTSASSPAVPAHLQMVFGLVGGLVGAVVPLYFLVTRRAAFRPPSDPIWPDAPG